MTLKTVVHTPNIHCHPGYMPTMCHDKDQATLPACSRGLNLPRPSWSPTPIVVPSPTCLRLAMPARPLTMALHPGRTLGRLPPLAFALVTGCFGSLPELTRAPPIKLDTGLAPTFAARLGAFSILAPWALARCMRGGSP
jgi:hypothetical protein